MIPRCIKKLPPLFIILFLISMQISVFAKSSSLEMLPSLEWQKINLQEKIQNQLDSALSILLKKSQYIVSIKIAINAPQKPNFSKAGKSKQEKNRVRMTNIDPTKTPQDSIVFAKMGLEAPLIEDFIEPKAETSTIEEMWDYNESLDLFKNIESIDIMISMSDLLSEDNRQAIQRVLGTINFNFGEISPVIQTEYIALEERIPPKSNWDDILNQLAKFSNLIGLILATILMGIIGLVLLKKYAALQKNQEAAGQPIDITNKSDNSKKDDQDLIQNIPMGNGELATQHDVVGGIDRFKIFYQSSPQDAIMLLKKWIKTDNEQENQALQALIQTLNNEELVSIFKMLTIEDRNEWKSKLKKPLSNEKIQESSYFISSQIIEEIIVPPVILDNEICNLLLGLTPAKSAELVHEHPDMGGILLNVMNTRYVSQILSEMDVDNAQKVIAESVAFSPKEVTNKLPQFKEVLQKYQVKKVRAPFVEKIIQLIHMVSPSKEAPLFKALAQNNEVDTIREICQTHFPANLIVKLPANLIKTILLRYPMSQKVELIASVPESIKDQFITIYAPEGSVARDMLDLELGKIKNDLTAQRKIRDESEKIWEEFVKFARTKIQEESSFAQDVESVVDEWINQLTDKPDQVSESNAA